MTIFNTYYSYTWIVIFALSFAELEFFSLLVSEGNIGSL